ncbi:unnamed protein product [Ambrosiozyma monospora]|uniref:Unnamed protein product n=1 Tax=Ambrosiozyma monospora TaxID=43982 RepID=A0A9W6Z0E2_AMBMO|nr:unnamed protein product [Ambrosiozyma monospora]
MFWKLNVFEKEREGNSENSVKKIVETGRGSFACIQFSEFTTAQVSLDSRLKTQDSRAPINYNSKQLLTDSKLIIRFISMYIPSSNTPSSNIPAHPAEHRINLLCRQSISPCNSNNVRSIRKLTMCGENYN